MLLPVPENRDQSPVWRINGCLQAKSGPSPFMNDTPTYDAMENKGGDCLLFGIPRIDLAIVSWRARNAKTRPEVLSWNLPYEIIVVRGYKEPCEKDCWRTP